jgi:Na+/H+ antiporter NhaD/arsenite permease-like protein
MSDPVALTIFGVVYLGMMLGRLPGLSLDRTGVALLGAIAMVATGRLELGEAWSAVDVPTIALLFGLMIVSAELRLGGFYTRVVQGLARESLAPPRLLAAIMVGVGGLAAVLTNDVVCLAAAPVLIATCTRRGLDPVPFLVGLACAANIGSAATLIGNPQNVLIGEARGVGFAHYALLAGPPVVLSLALAWAIVAFRTRGRWWRPGPRPVPSVDVPFERWPTAKAAAVVVGLVVLFTAGWGDRGMLALAGAGLLLSSRRTASREALALVDWQLLLLFVSLFTVHAGLERTGAPDEGLSALQRAGIDLRQPTWLFASTAVASNVVSNVPAVMLLLPAADGAVAATTMALASTLAGNLILVGSIANLIVVDQAQRLGERISWRAHARLGIPVTLATLAVTAAWLALVAWT